MQTPVKSESPDSVVKEGLNLRIDRKRWESLRELETDPNDSFLLDMIEHFESTATGALHTLSEAMGDFDKPRIVNAAHSIKGSAANIGARELSALASWLETLDFDIPDAFQQALSRIEIMKNLLNESTEEMRQLASAEYLEHPLRDPSQDSELSDKHTRH